MNTIPRLSLLMAAGLALLSCNSIIRKDSGATSGLRESGFLTKPVTVNLAAFTGSDGAEVLCTFDGSEPVPDNPKAAVVSTPTLRVEDTTVLRIRAYHGSQPVSEEMSRTWIFWDEVLIQQRPAGYPEMASVADSWRRETPVPWRYGTHAAAVAAVTPAEVKKSLQSLPSLSLVLNPEDFWGRDGIGSRPYDRGPAGRVPASLFGLGFGSDPAGQSFQTPAKVEIFGRTSRFPQASVKQSLRLVFPRSDTSKGLPFDLFSTGRAADFHSVVLRAATEDSWAVGTEPDQYWRRGSRTPLRQPGPELDYDWDQLPHAASYLRDAFAAETQRAMGVETPRRRFVHLYLNGLYWGVYELAEDCDAEFLAAAKGTAPDAGSGILLLLDDEVVSGGQVAEEAWDKLHHDLRPLLEAEFRLRGFWPLDGPPFDEPSETEVAELVRQRSERYEKISQQIDLQAFADFLILSGYLNQTRRARSYLAWRSAGEGGKFRFLLPDAAWTLRPGNWEKEPYKFWTNQQDQFTGPGYLFGGLSPTPEFQALFEARLAALLGRDGPLHPDQASVRMSLLAKGFRPGMAAEFARWGCAYERFSGEVGDATPRGAAELWKEALSVHEGFRQGHHLAFGNRDALLSKTSGVEGGFSSVPAEFWKNFLPSPDQLLRVVRPSSKPPGR